MRKGKADSLFERQCTPESEMCCQIQIYKPRNQIANRVSNINIDKQVEKIVDAVMDARGNQTDYGKSDKLPKLLGHIKSLELVCQNCSHTFYNVLPMTINTQ